MQFNVIPPGPYGELAGNISNKAIILLVWFYVDVGGYVYTVVMFLRILLFITCITNSPATAFYNNIGGELLWKLLFWDPSHWKIDKL